ncbi:SDR family NAD(P)-dependent oxidoreductase [Aquimarina aggregata]|uniref:SDR family NAD(P)-dependent oxidoreductase n=1 Tax=Aquimarina aggregata TaxID=1642818 RepID=UPI002493774D|nr:SDR family NAD(P)-dependent oxidoreductase [Aquimarina aggregata]
MKLEKLNTSYPNKSAFITGAGSGLGLAYAKLLAKNGWTLHLSDINRETLEQSSQSLEGAATVHLYTLNVSDTNEYSNVFNKVQEHSPKVDLLINNAGIGDGALFENYELENWERMIRINLLGTFYGCHHFVPMMQKQQNGLIINIGSAAGFLNGPGMSAYNVSKAGVYSLSETLYHELKSSNIHVSVVTPTFFKSNVMQSAKGSQDFKAFAEKQMKYSKTNADELAEVSMHEASKGKFQIIHPYDAKRNHFFKKWFPKLVEKQFEKMMAKLTRS